jgi:hypothetical protein
MESKSIKKLLAAADSCWQVSWQIIRASKGVYTLRCGCYADRAIALEWTARGFQLPSGMNCREAKRYLEK